MKLVCIGDTHGQHRLLILPKGDILIHTGDLMQGAWNKRQFEDLADWFSNMTYKKILYVPGNHDGLVEKDLTWVEKALPMVKILIDESIRIDGFLFHGSPWTPPFLNWYFMKHDDHMGIIYDAIPEDIDVLITHGPPRGILDQTTHGKFEGSYPLLLSRKNFHKLQLHVFGHIHEAHGLELELESELGLLNANVSVLNENYHLIHEPTVITLNL